MSIHDNENKALLDGNGTQTLFEFSFKIFKPEDLKVYKINKETRETGEALELNRDYTVEINKVGEGGSVNYAVAPTVEEQAGIYRDIAIIQPADIPVDTEYVEKTLEDALDRACMIDQQLQEQIDRSVKTPAFADISSVNFDTPVDGKATYWEVKNGEASLKNCQTNPDNLVAECSALKNECEVLQDECTDLANECALTENRTSELVRVAVGELPAKVPLSTWARLADGNIYNMPFPDVKAELNRFIQFEDKKSLRFKANTFIKLITSTETNHFCVWQDFVINVKDYLDEGDTLVNGKDYSIFLVPDEEIGIAIKISLNKTAPIGYDPINTRRIGGFHTECVDVGTISDGHPMNGWLAGEIIPSTVWTLWHKPLIASPSGMYYHRKLDGWRPIYSQSGTMENTVFEYGATTTRSRTAWDHEVDLGLVGLEFPKSYQFTIASLGVIPLKAVSGKAESSCTKAGGWKNENNIRMVTEEGEESTCGGLWEILEEYGPCGGSNWAASGSNTLTQPYQYGSINRLLGGGAWYGSGYCGPSSRHGSHSATSTAAGVSARGWSRPYRPRD